MTMDRPPDYREEVDIVRIDPLFLERQRNRYASRAVAFLVLLNGVAALFVLASLLRLNPQIENAHRVADAMVVFGAGVAAALASMFFAYLRRTILLRAPQRAPAIPFGWWLALVAAIASAACFVVGLRMVGRAVAPALVTAATHSKALANKQGSAEKEGDRDEKLDKVQKGGPAQRQEKSDSGER